MKFDIWNKASIKFKLIVIPIILILIGFLGISIVSSNLIKSNLLDQKRKEGFRLANQVTRQIADNSNSLKTIDRMLEEKIRGAAKAVMLNKDNLSNKFLKQLADDLGVNEIYWYNSSGEIIFSTIDGYLGWTPSEDHPVYQFMTSGKDELIAGIRKDTESENYNKYGYVRNSDGSFVQIGIRANNVESLKNKFSYQNLMEELATEENVIYSSFINKDLEAVAHSNKDKIGNKITGQGSKTAAEEGEAYSSESFYEAKGINIYDVSIPVVIDGEHIGAIKIGFSMEEIYSTINKARIIILAIGLVLFAILGGILFNTSNSIVKSLNVAVEHCKSMAAGDFSTTVRDKWVKREDEIGDLADGFKEITFNMNEMVNNIKDLVEDLSAYSEELSASAQEGNATIETTNELVEDISANIEEISASAQQVSSFAQESSSKTEVGSDNIEDTLASINEISQSTNEAVGIINELDDTSSEIEKIVEMITNIAEQTNLLALNAAIEAARAGEAGQGFAVVAEEIRELAEETNEATEEIANLIDDTQNKTDHGLEAVKKVEAKASKGQKVVAETREVFTEIQEASDQTAAQIQQTAGATSDLARKSEQVSSSTDDIQNMSDDVANSSQELANMAQELKALIEEFEV